MKFYAKHDLYTFLKKSMELYHAGTEEYPQKKNWSITTLLLRNTGLVLRR